MKKTISDLKIKLKRLKELGGTNYYNWNSLNQYSDFLNEVIISCNLRSVQQISPLVEADSIHGSNTNSAEEIAKLEELINKYSEALTEIKPSIGINILSEFSQSTTKFKLINAGVLIAVATLFYTIGNDGKLINPRKNSSDKIVSDTSSLFKISELEIQLKESNLSVEYLERKIDSLENMPKKIDVSYLEPRSIFNGRVFINAKEDGIYESIMEFKGDVIVSHDSNWEFEKKQINVKEGDRFYLKFEDTIWIINIIDLVSGIEFEMVKTTPNNE